MCDYISITRIWQDNDLFMIEVECKTELITVRGKIYTSNELIDDLRSKIEMFLSGSEDSVLWQNGIRGDEATPCVSFFFSHKDKLGHVQVEVFMEIDDGGYLSSHNCCFYINTEYGLLYTFRDKLQLLKANTIGVKVILGSEHNN